jgi:LPS-assembly lipoprotein
MPALSRSVVLPSRRAALLAMVGLSTLTLAGCGFALRGTQTYRFSSLYLGRTQDSAFLTELQRTLESDGKLTVVTDVQQQNTAQVVLQLLGEQREKVVVGVTAAGQVREFQLRQSVKFRLRSQSGRDLIEDTELVQQRDISFNESAVLSKEAEEALLYRNMQSDLVQQILRRLAAVQLP